MTRPSQHPGRRRRRRLLLLAAGFLLALPALVHEQVRWAGHGRVVEDPAASRSAPVAIVLGSGVRPDGRPHPVLQARIDTAAALWHAGKVSRVLCSGHGGDRWYDEPQAMRRALVAQGVPDARIDEDPYGYRTLDSMVRAHTVFGIDDAVVVTQAYHLPRALFLGDRLGGMRLSGVAAPQRQRSRLVLGTPRREIGARFLAWLDVYVLGTAPEIPGVPEQTASGGP